jgi:hypothetical protein
VRPFNVRARRQPREEPVMSLPAPHGSTEEGAR